MIDHLMKMGLIKAISENFNTVIDERKDEVCDVYYNINKHLADNANLGLGLMALCMSFYNGVTWLLQSDKNPNKQISDTDIIETMLICFKQFMLIPPDRLHELYELVDKKDKENERPTIQ